MEDSTVIEEYTAPDYDAENIETYANDILKLESVASKDWLTNKVDRS